MFTTMSSTCRSGAGKMHVAEKCSENETALTSSVETEFATPTKSHALDVCPNLSKGRIRYTKSCVCCIPRENHHLVARIHPLHSVLSQAVNAWSRTSDYSTQSPSRSQSSKPSTIPTFFLDTDRYHHSNTALSSISLEYRLSNQATPSSLPLPSSFRNTKAR